MRLPDLDRRTIAQAELVLSVEVEDRAARDEEGDVRGAGDELGNCGHCTEEMLEVVQHDQLMT
jgi:hypothetical protein